MAERRNAEHYIDLTAYYAIRNIEREGKRKMEENMEVYRGEVWFVDYGRSNGSEQDAGRPAVIVSNDIGNKHSRIVEVVYLTTAEKKPLPTHVDVMCKVPSTALCEQVNSVSKDRLVEYVRTCTKQEMDEIDNALLVSLGLTAPKSIAIVEAVSPDHSEELNEFKNKCNELEEACSRLMIENDELKAEPLVDSATIIRLETERDLYKKQYEHLFERLLEK